MVMGVTVVISRADEPAVKVPQTPAGAVRAIRTMTLTVTGELLDSQCFLSAKRRGESHRACAQKCARQGLPVMIVDQDTGQVYVLIAAAPKLAPYMAQTATITGHASGGILVPDRIEVKGKVIPIHDEPKSGREERR